MKYIVLVIYVFFLCSCSSGSGGGGGEVYNPSIDVGEEIELVDSRSFFPATMPADYASLSITDSALSDNLSSYISITVVNKNYGDYTYPVVMIKGISEGINVKFKITVSYKGDSLEKEYIYNVTPDPNALKTKQIDDQTMLPSAGNVLRITLSNHFISGYDKTYGTPSNSNSSIGTAKIIDGEFQFTKTGDFGTTRISITCTSNGKTATLYFNITVTDDPGALHTKPIPDYIMKSSDNSIEIILSEYFMSNYERTYDNPTSSNATIGTPSISSSGEEFTFVKTGTTGSTDISITCHSNGRSLTLTFKITVKNASKYNKRVEIKPDNSFEERMLSHKQEMENLYKKYIVDPNYEFVPQTFGSFGTFFIEDAKAQYKYMQENNIAIGNQVTDKTVKEKFGFTKEDNNKYKNLYYVVKNDVTNGMQQDIFLALKYYDLAEKITYTKLEIFRDATGYDNPEQYETDHNITDGKFKKYRPIGKKSGIGANAAIAKLKKIYDTMYPVNNNKPAEYNLRQNYPNPFNPETNITYTLAKECKVKLTVYNMLGQEVVTLVNGVQKAGINTAHWNGCGKNGVITGAGVYVYKLESEEFKSAKMMLMLK